ncbi:hypothetical protein DYB32_005279, partial [Aphanomyces invadans]
PMIHPTAVVHPNARLGHDVHIGPYCTIGPGGFSSKLCFRTSSSTLAEVSLHDNVVLKSHVVVEGDTTIGENTALFPFACIGGPPQDKKHVPGGHSALVIGKNCLIRYIDPASGFIRHGLLVREHVTINSGTSLGAGTTRVGDECWVYYDLIDHHLPEPPGFFIAHLHQVCLAGHVTIQDLAIVGGQVGIKQFVHIGRYMLDLFLSYLF